MLLQDSFQFLDCNEINRVLSNIISVVRGYISLLALPGDQGICDKVSLGGIQCCLQGGDGAHHAKENYGTPHLHETFSHPSCITLGAQSRFTIPAQSAGDRYSQGAFPQFVCLFDLYAAHPPPNI